MTSWPAETTRTDRTILVICGVLIFLCLFIIVFSAYRTSRSQTMPYQKLPQFPSNFIFGAATAAYQIEGAYNEDGRGMSIWDTFSHMPGKVFRGDTGDVADDHYHRVPEDVQLAKKMNLKNYRMSLSWSRIMSDGTKKTLNQKGIDHYSREIDAWNDAGIDVYVTLYHWDLPQHLEDEYGGWLNQTAMVQFFTEYADVCFELFGDRVKHWMTFNEPWVTSVLAYGVGVNAPGRCTTCDSGNSATEPYIVGHNQLLAHAHAVDLYRNKYQSYQRGLIGIVLNSDYLEPFSSKKEDVEAAQRHQEFFLGWFGDPVFFGDYPQVMKDRVGDRLPTFSSTEKILLRNSLDFLGINHYTSQYVSNNPDSEANKDYFNDIGTTTKFEDNKGNLIGSPSDAKWLYVVPWGIRKLMNWIKLRYNNPIVFITENGVPVPEEDSMKLEDAIDDDYRIDYLHKYLTQLSTAINDDKCNVQGYFVWSLLDNFEWADGYSKRFGIHYVDYKDPELKRYPKKSSVWYSELIKTYK